MSDETRSMLVRGTAAARVGEVQEARKYLEWLFELDPTDEEKAEAWYWLAKIVADPAEKRNYLEQILARDPFDPRARKEFSILTGRLKTEDLVDPNCLPPSAQGPVEKTSSERFTCPTCGGRMVYSPDGQSLICEYCENRARRENQASGSGNPQADDFLLSLATAKGHTLPRQVHTLLCQGCGAEFYVPPAVISLNCPFCGSSHVLLPDHPRERIEPGGIIPFFVNEAGAHSLAEKWFEQKNISMDLARYRFNGIYLPVWLFTMGGQLDWRCQIQVQDWRGKEKWIDQSGNAFPGNEKILIPAFVSDNFHLAEQLAEIDPDSIQEYDPAFLASWPAQTYQVSMADASLDARQEALKIERERIIAGLSDNYRDLSISSARMVVDTYLLFLFPVWILAPDSQLRPDGQERRPVLVINGQSGTINGDLPRSGFWRFLFGD